jgi:hypothetical protein
MNKTLKDRMLDFVQEKGEAKYTEIVEFLVDSRYGEGTYKKNPEQYRGVGSAGFSGLVEVKEDTFLGVEKTYNWFWGSRKIIYGQFKIPSMYTRRFLWKNPGGGYNVLKRTKKGNVKMLIKDEKIKMDFPKKKIK